LKRLQGETDVKLSMSLPRFLKLELMHKISMQIATSGKGFCRAAGKASALIVSNVLKVAAVNILGDLILYFWAKFVSAWSVHYLPSSCLKLISTSLATAKSHHRFFLSWSVTTQFPHH